MYAYLLSCAVAALLLGQVDPGGAVRGAPPDESVTDEEIERAVRELGDARFVVRQAASRFLWQQGLQAEPALREAARSRDAETRSRARRILRDFDYGLLPGVPVEVAQRIVAFRDGNAAARVRAIEKLLDGNHVDTALQLIRRESDGDARRRLLGLLFDNREAMDRFATTADIESLVEMVAADQNAAWRRRAVAELLFSPAMIERLAENDQLETLTKFVEREKDRTVLAQMLNSVFANPRTLEAMLAHGDLRLAASLLDATPDAQQRSLLLSQLFTNEKMLERILDQEKLDEALALLKSLDAAARRDLIYRVFRSPAMSRLLEQQGLDALIAWLRKEKDPELRGKLLAALVGSPHLRQQMEDAERAKAVVEIAEEESERAARHAYLDALFQNPFAAVPNDRAARDRLWRLVESDEDASWRAGAVALLMRNHAMRQMLSEAIDPLWLLETAEAADADARPPLLQAILNDRSTFAGLMADDRFDDLLQLILRAEAEQRGMLLARLVRQQEATAYLTSKGRLPRLLSLATDELSGPPRQEYLESLLGSASAVTALIDGGYYDALADLALQTDDAVQRATRFGRLAAHQGVTQHLAQTDRLDTLVEFAAAQEDAAARAAFLQPLYTSSALARLVDGGHYASLLAFLDEQSPSQDALTGSFYANPAVIARFVEREQIPQLAAQLDSLNDAARQQFLQQLGSNRGALVDLVRASQLERLLEMLETAPDRQRHSLVGSLLGSADVADLLAAKNELPKLTAVVLAEQDAGARRMMSQSLLNHHNVVEAWVHRGALEQVLEIARAEPDVRQRGSRLARVVIIPSVIAQLARDERLASVLDWADSFGEGGDAAAARQQYLTELFANTGVVGTLIESGRLEEMLETVRGEPDRNGRASLLRSLAQHPATVGYLTGQGQLPRLLGLADEEPAEPVRYAYVQGLLNNRTAIAALLADGHYDALEDVVLAARSPVQRATLFGQLVQHRPVTQHLENRKRLVHLVEFAEAQETGEARAAFLQPLFGSSAMAPLIGDGHYDRLSAFLDEPLSDRIAASFYSQPAVANRFVESGRAAVLMKRIESIDPAARSRALQQLVHNHALLAPLVEAGQFDALQALVEAEPNEHHRGVVAASLLTAASVIEHLADQEKLSRVVEILRGEQFPNARRRMLERQLSTPALLEKLLESGHLQALVELAQSEPTHSVRGRLLGRLLAAPQVAEHLAAHDRLGDTLEAVRAEKDARVRSGIVQWLANDDRTVAAWLDAEMLDPLIELVLADNGLDQKGSRLARLVARNPVLDAWSNAGRLDSLLDIADRLGEAGSGEHRRQYLQAVLADRTAVRMLIADGRFEDLLRLALEPRDPDTRARGLGSLVRHPATAEYLAEHDQVDRLIEIARDQPHPASRRACVTGIVANAEAVARLREADRLDPLVALCREESDETARRRLQGQLLRSAEFVRHLAERELLVETVEGALAESDRKARAEFLAELFGNAEALVAVERGGMFGPLLEAVDAEEDGALRTQMLVPLLDSPEGLELIAEHDRMSLILALPGGERSDSMRRQHIGKMLARPTVLRAWLERESFESILKRFPIHDLSYAHTLASAIGSDGVLEVLAEAGQLDTLFERAAADPVGSLRQRLLHSLLSPTRRHLTERPEIARRLVSLVAEGSGEVGSREAASLLSNGVLRHAMFADGETERLLELLPRVPEAQRAGLRHQLLFSPSGLVAFHTLRDELDAAEQVLQEQAAEGDEGRLLLASFLAIHDRLEPRIAELESQADDANAARTLVYLHRAGGDLAAAQSAAERTGDADLVHAVTLERRDWLAAAEQLADEPRAPPVPLPRRAPSEPHAELERLAYLAAYWRLAGERERAAEVLDRIEQFAVDHREVAGVGWCCGQALLLNERVDAGLALVADAKPAVAFALYCARREYVPALDVLDSPPGGAFDQQWYDGLPVAEKRREQRLKLAMRIARVLRNLGHTRDAAKIIATIEANTERQPKTLERDPFGGAGFAPPRRSHWEWLARELYRSALHEAAWQAAEQAMEDEMHHRSVLPRLFPKRSKEAIAWWGYFRRNHREEAPRAIVRRVHQVLTGRAPDSPEAFEQWVREAAAGADDPGRQRATGIVPNGDEARAGLADTCLARGRLDLAEWLLKELPDATALPKLAEAYRRGGEWRKAAATHLKLWQARRDRPALLYLSGDALVRAGDVEAGERRKRRARSLALDSRVLHTMAITLNDEGLADDAAELWRWVARTAPFDHWQRNDAIRLLGDAVHRQQASEAADHWEQYMLTNLRSTSFFNNDAHYVHLPFIIRWRRAVQAVADGEVDEAVRHAEQALAAKPGDLQMVEELTPLFEAAQRPDAADALFDRVWRHYQQGLEQFPDAPHLHNNAAWLAARCQRRLEEALEHARRAIDGAPNRPAYHDTLAEVHFQLGNRAEAVRHSQRSVALGPAQPAFRKQLERFRNDSLPENVVEN